MAVVDDRGFWITRQAIRRQLAAMPHELYLVRLIHHQTREAFPGERLWTAVQLESAATVRFLRVRNREGCDIYVQPYAADQNAGYILVDLDAARPMVIRTMRSQGHDPCVVLQTSPATCRPGFASASLPWNQRWPPLLASCWRRLMEAIAPAPTGATWEGSPASPIRSPHDALLPATRRG